jgi:flagellum-specific peptidoglycan hydrolase FlgJ
MIRKILLVFILVFLASCHANKTVIVTKKEDRYNPNKYKKKSSTPSSKAGSTNGVVKDYVVNYKEVAMGNMKKYGIPASIILAQGILESGAGKGNLALTANNHFGIKCHSDWTGESVLQDDDAAQECFRKYNQASESYNDHALFLKSRRWYDPLFKLEKDDYKGWAKGLKAAGYATDPKYPEKLIGIIERYHLDQYDAEVLGKQFATPIVPTEVNKKEYEVIKGDTMYSISKKFNISIDDLKSKNNILDNTISVGQVLIIE